MRAATPDSARREADETGTWGREWSAAECPRPSDRWRYCELRWQGRRDENDIGSPRGRVSNRLGHSTPFSDAEGCGGFGDIGTENHRVITMEWIYEGATLIFAGFLAVVVTLIGDDTSTTATVAYVATAALLIVMAVISLVTAGRNRFIAYRLCAPIFTLSAILLLVTAAI